MKNESYLSLGTNIGDREGFLTKAIKELVEHSDIQVEQISSIYETDPVGYVDQDPFLNLVIKISTNLTPLQLLDVTQGIENSLGRKRELRWGPRTIDLDILLFNHENIEVENLRIPHPRMFERSFVLIPLNEINQSLEIETKFLEDKGVRLWKLKSGGDGLGLLEN
ncbi:2-amino-4-hydroxy-6-hydroxymethyldihydropteridine diphosphokinase [Bacillus sp. AFS017336]|uniref:2-amino-4-hydroxy-6- hydroxymethyldihydropteridine diphosphokinase n=1 Tax=Bacillus sp. AFS017336 TaxID=2033489 RepID=UPI000BF244F3|nr:2-amino-4-hydroxy-6-hydroxymethyldihydropteridine diphosphokinase [Bacillus sp. AFS017336]PEL10038.1 2-amino-4-hydroxy-6-hydroxymethyldihydropteridine diphosphokinase [Bacillus sp. AFS017336]